MKPLKRDRDKTLDAPVPCAIQRHPLRVVGTSTHAVALTTNGTATATQFPWRSTAATTKPSSMSEGAEHPAYSGDDYMALACHHVEDFQNNLKPPPIHPEGLQMIFRGEIGRYENCRYVEQTNIPKGAANSTTWNAYTNTADAWDNALSDWIFFWRGHRGGRDCGSRGNPGEDSDRLRPLRGGRLVLPGWVWPGEYRRRQCPRRQVGFRRLTNLQPIFQTRGFRPFPFWRLNHGNQKMSYDAALYAADCWWWNPVRCQTELPSSRLTRQ